MLSPEERALALHMADKLIALYAQREVAVDDGDLVRVCELQFEINETIAARQEVLQSGEC
jgi:hypothetical protein